MRARWLVLITSAGLVAGGATVPAAAARTKGSSTPNHPPAPSRSVRSDFNGDGFQDLAVGDPFEDLNGKADAGAVNVLYATTAGLQPSSPRNQFWSQDSPGVEDMAQPDDRFGWSLASGDFNGDGFSDLAVGAYLEDVLLQDGSKLIANAGAVNVLYGSSSGLQTDAPADQFWSQETPGMVGAAEHRDWFGFALASGDFDGDGYADLAVGVQGEDGHFESIPRSGAVDTIYGSPAGLASAGNQHIDQDTEGLLGVAEPYDNFGNTLASADFNSDGFDDLAVGVPNEDVHTLANAGVTQVLYGAAGVGLQADSPDDQMWDQEIEGVQGELATNDLFGFSLAVGDFNGDGFPDLACGVPGEEVGPVVDAGYAEVLYGTAAGLQADAPDDQVWSQDSPGVLDDAEAGDGFGFAVASGDFNGDGFDDLAVGVPGEDNGVTADVGTVAVIYGSAAGLQADSPDDQEWMQGIGGVKDHAEAGDELGYAVFAADFDGTGTSDLAAGVPFEDGIPADVGSVSVLYGSAGGLQATAPDDQVWWQDSNQVLDRAEEGDQFGSAVG